MSYTQGYVGTGSAIVFNQSTPTWISIPNPFNISGVSFTIEAFIILHNNSINASLLQFSSNMSLVIQMGRLRFILNEKYSVSSFKELSLNGWHHIAVVYSVESGYTSIFLDGRVAGQLAYISNVNSPYQNVTLTLASGFQGVIDQLSISLEAKNDQRILWDATVAAFYPLDGFNMDLRLDYGPNCFNATTAGTQSITGAVGNGLNFVTSGAYYQARGFTMLNFVKQSFSVALWVRLQNRAGVFLTIANPFSCLLVLGIRSSDNRTIAYLPNATNKNTSVNLLGSLIPTNQWVHIAFTWSPQNQAQFYQNSAYQGTSNLATKLNNGIGEPMTVTLGMHRGTANCDGAEGIDMTQQYSGGIDEFYVYSRELQQDEIERLNMTARV